mmetsp:Transcript_27887/g.31884  ORF Transcript_27887/g.31884 Transcript_27887/m.31884 type:complete len:658 (-) Transcript_27887:98-2071(-)
MVSTRRSSFSIPSLPTKSIGSPLTKRSPFCSSFSKINIAYTNCENKQQKLLPPLASTVLLNKHPLPKMARSRTISIKCKKQAKRRNSNFLHGINPDCCNDLLSIPDPPSPSIKNVRRRSLSSPFLDLTNSSSHQKVKKLRRSLAPETSSLSEFKSEVKAGAKIPEGKDLIQEKKWKQLSKSDFLGASDYASKPESCTSKESMKGRRTCLIPQIYDLTHRTKRVSYSKVAFSTCNKKEKILFTPLRKDQLTKFSKLETATDLSHWNTENLLKKTKVPQKYVVPSHGNCSPGNFTRRKDTRHRKKRHSLDFSVIRDAGREFECAILTENYPFNKKTLSVYHRVNDENISDPGRKRCLKLLPTENEKKNLNFLPSPLSKDSNQKVVRTYFENLSKYGGTRKTGEDSKKMKSTADDNKIGENKRIDVRNLVRRYCSLPRSKRGTSNEAREIENSTNYPLLFSGDINEDEDNRILVTKRRSLLADLVPVVKQMDERKVEERSLYEEMTGFRAEKSRGGRFRYFSTTASTRIAPQEYQTLYLQMQQQLTLARSQCIVKFLQGYDTDVWGKKKDLVKRYFSSPSQLQNMPTRSDGARKADVSKIERNDPISNQIKLRLPAREDVPSDPDIRLAHEQLWSTIDNALESYSFTICTIQAARAHDHT